MAPAHAAFLHHRLRDSSMELPEAGHLVWEDQADAYAASALDWWTVHQVAVSLRRRA